MTPPRIAVAPDWAPRWLADAVVAGGGAVVEPPDAEGLVWAVTDPEPLPAGHPLWSLPNCLVTPHVAGNTAAALRLLAPRISESVRRFGAGEPLAGGIDPALGY